MRLGILTVVFLPLLVAACVPDFVFGDGADPTSSTSGDGDGDGDGGDGGRRRPDGDGGDGGGRRPSTVGGLSTTDTAGPAGSTATGSTPTVSASSGGEGGAGTHSTTSSTATTTGASTGSGGTPGVPCWDGGDDQVVTCSGGESSCCPDIQYYEFDECGPPGGCGGFAWELGCNESADCGSQLCCVITDGDGGLASIGCSASCSEFEACDPSVGGCSGGKTCSPIPQLDDDSHPEYGAYGYCN